MAGQRLDDEDESVMIHRAFEVVPLGEDRAVKRAAAPDATTRISSPWRSGVLSHSLRRTGPSEQGYRILLRDVDTEDVEQVGIVPGRFEATPLDADRSGWISTPQVEHQTAEECKIRRSSAQSRPLRVHRRGDAFGEQMHRLPIGRVEHLDREMAHAGVGVRPVVGDRFLRRRS
jgi:hypothetical protein